MTSEQAGATPHQNRYKISKIRRLIDIVLAICFILCIPSASYLPVRLKTVAGPFSISRNARSADLFPMSDALRPQVTFWKKIFTEYDRSQMVIHDAWYLSVIYEVVDLRKAGKNPRGVVHAAVERYRNLLEEMAENWEQPEKMGKEARQMHALFKDIPESPRFKIKDAKDRVRFQMGQADSFKKGITWAGRHMDDIKKILIEYGLPRELAYLPLIESAFNPFSTSHVGAAGMWQLMRRTAKEYSLVMNHLVDERRDPLLSTRTAARHLAHNYKVLKSWPLAITAYNHGLQGMVNAVRRVRSEDIAEIIGKYDGSRFEFASRNFYPEFLAALEVGYHPARYYGEITPVPAVRTVCFELPDHVAAQTLEEYCGITTAYIQELNPALLNAAFRPSYFLPKGYGLNVLPQDKERIEKAYSAIPERLKYRYLATQKTHRVRRGQTLSEIATLHHTSARTLMRLNGIRNPRRIRVGQRLKVPGRYVAAGKDPKAVRSGAGKRKAPLPDLGRQHRVKRGETLSGIARIYGISTKSIARLNAIRNSRKLRAGQVLKIPEG